MDKDIVEAYEEMIKYHTKLRNWVLVEIYFVTLGNVLETLSNYVSEKDNEG